MNKLTKRILSISVGAVLTVSAFAGAQLATQIMNTPAPAAEAPSTPTLLAHYDFNNISGTAVPDVTGNGYDGKLEGSDYTIAADTVSFNEKSDVAYGSGVKLTKNVFADTADDVTITAWVKPPANDNGAIRTLFNLNRTTVQDTANYALWITRFNGEGLRYLNGAAVQTKTFLKANEWNLLTLVQKGSMVYMYLNDALVTSIECPRRLCDIPDGVVTFAKAITWPDLGFRGAIDDIKIYNGALNDLQIAQEYQKTMYPIAGFSVAGYSASVNQTTKEMILSLPETVSLENVSPVITSNAVAFTINGADFTAGDTVTLNLGENTVGYTTATGDSGIYKLNILIARLEKLADFNFAAENIDADGNVTELCGNGYTAKLGDSAQPKEDYVNLNGGYIDIDRSLIADTGTALTVNFTVNLEKNVEMQNNLLSAGNETSGRLLLSTASRPESEGPRWALKPGASGESIVKSDYFLSYEQWMHITYTQSNAVAKIYVNGICVASGTSILPASMIGETTTYIGKSTDPSIKSGLDGQIAAFSVYTGAMDDAQVAALHADTPLPDSYEIYEPSDAECDLLGFAYPDKAYSLSIKDYVIHVTADSNDPLGEPRILVSEGATYKIEYGMLIITAANGVDQQVYKLDVQYPKSNIAQLHTATVNDLTATIDETAKTVKIDLPAGVDPAIAVVDAVAMNNGTVDCENEQITVTAEDGTTTATYAVEIGVKKYAITQLTSVTVNGRPAAINQSAKTVSIELAYNETVSEIQATADYNATAEVAADHTYITVTAEDGTTTATYTLNITHTEKPQEDTSSKPSQPTPQPSQPVTPVYKNKVVGNTAYDKDGKKITGTKVVKVGKAYRAIVKGKVQTGTKIIKVGKSYRAIKNGKVVYRSKAALVKIGKKQYVVSKKGIVTIKKIVKVGKKQYVNKSRKAGIYKKATFKLKGKTYKANKKGIVTRKK